MDQTFEKRKKVIYDFMRDDLYVPMKIKEIAILLQIPGEQREELRQVLDALVEEGKISVSKRGKYSCGAAQRFSGSFQANARGFGFVTPSDGEEDVFISEENINGAFQGDEVEYIIIKSRGGQRKEGKIVLIISHTVTRIVGMYEKNKNFGFVRPDNQRYLKDIYIPAGKENGAMTGHKVLVELTSYGGESAKPEGRVAEIIGHINDPGTDILSIVMDFGIETEFPEKVLNQAVRVGKDVSPADCQGRMDLREWQMVTIDGEDAKDLDDAVSLTREGENYRLGVHIADVANYVQERSALDREALPTEDLESTVTDTGATVLLPGQNPMALDEDGAVSISSMGFASDGCSHVRFVQEEDIVPLMDDGHPCYVEYYLYDPEDPARWPQQGMGDVICTAVEGGWDFCLPGLTPDTLKYLDLMHLSTEYSAAGGKIEGSWEITVPVEVLDLRTATPAEPLMLPYTIGGEMPFGRTWDAQLDQITVSPLSVCTNFGTPEGQEAPCQLTGTELSLSVSLADGTTLTPAYYDEVWSQRAGWVMWEFEAPIDPDQVISVTLNGETLPID